MPCITQEGLAFIYSENRRDNAACAHTVRLVTVVDARHDGYRVVGCCATTQGTQAADDVVCIGREEENPGGPVARGADPPVAQEFA